MVVALCRPARVRLGGGGRDLRRRMRRGLLVELERDSSRVRLLNHLVDFQRFRSDCSS